MNLDHEKPYIITVPNVLTPEECRRLIDRIDAQGPTIATINTRRGVRVKPSVRNNERVIFDDPVLANLLLDRAQSYIPDEIHGMNLCGANERLRCYRYQPGMRFAPHMDDAFHRNEHEQSWYSYLVYLNGGFEGGNTTFLVEPEVSITPEAGNGLLFQHELIHEGSEVLSGTKYVVRTDVMYRSKESRASQGGSVGLPDGTCIMTGSPVIPLAPE